MVRPRGGARHFTGGRDYKTERLRAGVKYKRKTDRSKKAASKEQKTGKRSVPRRSQAEPTTPARSPVCARCGDPIRSWEQSRAQPQTNDKSALVHSRCARRGNRASAEPAIPESIVRFAPDHASAERAWNGLHPIHRTAIRLYYQEENFDVREYGWTDEDLKALFWEGWRAWHAALRAAPQPLADNPEGSAASAGDQSPDPKDSTHVLLGDPVISGTDLHTLTSIVEAVERRTLSPDEVDSLSRNAWASQVAAYLPWGREALEKAARQAVTAGGVSWAVWQQVLLRQSDRRRPS